MASTSRSVSGSESGGRAGRRGALVLRRSAQGLVTTAVMLLGVAAGRIEAMGSPKLWVLLAVGTLAHSFQPAFSPLAPGTPRDRGTARQILYSIAATQILALGEALYLRFPASLAWSPVAIVALLIMVSGLALRTWAVVVLGRHFTWHVEVEPGQPVVTRGPYRVVRHPSYTGALLTYLAIPVFLGAWLSCAVAAVLLPLAFARRIRHEERALMAELGDPYRSYQGRVGGLAPRLVRRRRARPA